MRSLSIFEKIIVWFKSLFIDEEEEKENSDKVKRQICKKAVQSGVCLNTCDTCVWNTLKGRK